MWGRRRAATVTLAILGACAPAGAAGAVAPNAHTARGVIDTADRGPSSQDVIRYARRFIGTPYHWGGSTPAGFDCSGYIQYVYARFGVRMDHSTYAIRGAFPPVSRANLRAGDIVFFAGDGHAGIYIGRGRFIHSPSSGKRIHIARLTDGWYARSYGGAVRPTLPSQRARSTSGSDTGRSAGTRSASSAAVRA
jgi:cell wall-associated NlpC family hydrolase